MAARRIARVVPEPAVDRHRDRRRLHRARAHPARRRSGDRRQPRRPGVRRAGPPGRLSAHAPDAATSLLRAHSPGHPFRLRRAPAPVVSAGAGGDGALAARAAAQRAAAWTRACPQLERRLSGRQRGRDRSRPAGSRAGDSIGARACGLRGGGDRCARRDHRARSRALSGEVRLHLAARAAGRRDVARDARESPRQGIELVRMVRGRRSAVVALRRACGREPGRGAVSGGGGQADLDPARGHAEDHRDHCGAVVRGGAGRSGERDSRPHRRTAGRRDGEEHPQRRFGRGQGGDPSFAPTRSRRWPRRCCSS